MTTHLNLPPVDTRAVREQLESMLQRRIMVLDGAMGTMIQGYGLGEDDFRGDRFGKAEKLLTGDNELLSLTRPNIIREIHDQFLAAGSDILETNTFGATRVAQSEYGLADTAYDLNVASAQPLPEGIIAFRGSQRR